MNYQEIYNNLISYRQQNIPNEYTEKHHIIPRSCNGTDDEDNLVKLTAREHYIAHKLLVKIYTGKHKSKMIYALWLMSRNSRHIKCSSRDYEFARKLFSENNPNKCIERKKRYSEKYYAGEYNFDHAARGKVLGQTLSRLTDEEKQDRYKKSWGAADPIKRGKAISEALSKLSPEKKLERYYASGGSPEARIKAAASTSKTRATIMKASFADGTCIIYSSLDIIPGIQNDKKDFYRIKLQIERNDNKPKLERDRLITYEFVRKNVNRNNKNIEGNQWKEK